MGRHFTLDNSSTKHLMHVGGDNKHLGDDSDCSSTDPPWTGEPDDPADPDPGGPDPPTGGPPDDGGGDDPPDEGGGYADGMPSSDACFFDFDDDSPSPWNEYRQPCHERHNNSATCFDKRLPCAWDMVISGVHPLTNYGELAKKCGNPTDWAWRDYGGLLHDASGNPVRGETPDYQCTGCSGITYFGEQGGTNWHHHEHSAGTRPTVNINGTYLIHFSSGTPAWSSPGLLLKSYNLVEVDDGTNEWTLNAYMTFHSCSGGWNYNDNISYWEDQNDAAPGDEKSLKDAWDQVNPQKYDMKDGVNLFLLWTTNSATMKGQFGPTGYSQYQWFMSDCGFHRANVFRSNKQNFNCLGTNVFRNDITGKYKVSQNLSSPEIIPEVVIPYYSGGSITATPKPDAYYA